MEAMIARRQRRRHECASAEKAIESDGLTFGSEINIENLAHLKSIDYTEGSTQLGETLGPPAPSVPQSGLTGYSQAMHLQSRDTAPADEQQQHQLSIATDSPDAMRLRRL